MSGLRWMAACLASGLFLSHPVFRLTEGRARLWRGCGFVGSAWGVAACWFWTSREHSIAFTTAVLIAATLASIVIADIAEAYYGKKDESRIVIDEFAGYAWAGIWFGKEFVFIAAAFVLFRIFDVTKPLGIRRLESLPGGWGCVLDDVASGILTAVILAMVKACL